MIVGVISAQAESEYDPSANNLSWDFTEQAPSKNPIDGLYYESKVDDGLGTNNGLKGIKLNSTGYAFFAKNAVEGTLTLTIGPRSGNNEFDVNVYACTISDGKATKGELIATSDKVTESNSVNINIPASVTGIYITRNTPVEGVLSKIVFKQKANRDFIDFEITNAEMQGEYDASKLPEGVTFTGTQRNDTHGYGGVTLVVPVDGTVKFTIGGCRYANQDFTVTNADGKTLATLSTTTDKCYHEDQSSITYIYTGEPTTLTFSSIQYLPYFKAEATEVSEVIITYKDQDGKTLGTKNVYEGEAIGAIPYTENDLTIAEGYKFRGWVYTNGVKVKENDVVTGNTTIKASVTAIESVETGSVQTYDLTKNIFYPEDHETFSVDKGTYYNNHGFTFEAGGSFTIDVAGRAQIILTLCQYGNGTTIKVTDAAGNIVKDNVPAIVETDGGMAIVQYDGAATKLTFTFETQAYLHMVKVYNVTDFIKKDEVSGYYILPAGDAASLLMALNTASGEEGAKIFLPDGTYDLGEATQTAVSGKNVSLIGQSADKTIIVSAPPISEEGLGKADLLANSGEGLYIQDISLKNALDYYGAGSAGRAASLHDTGTKTICKNVKLLSYQDTYYSHKVGGLYYFEGGEIHGTVDYLCGNGKAYFNEVTFVNEKRNSATISANSELYVFNNCIVKNNADTYNFGRAWSDHPVCVYLNTTLEDPSKLASTRWNLSGINCDYKVAGEYGTKNAQGEDITPASNNVTFTKENTKLNTILDASALETYSISNVLGEWAATAQAEAKQSAAPADAKYDNGTVTWTAVNGATAYALFKNEIFAGITTGTTYNITINESSDKLTIRAANTRGGFGEAADVFSPATDAISIVKTENDEAVIYNLQGQRTNKIQKGINIVSGNKMVVK